MKKSRIQKLTLSKETLRSLDQNRLSAVAGGVTFDNCNSKQPGCNTQYTNCGSCGIACTVDC